MSVYFVANIKVNDIEEYQKYLDGCDEVFIKYNGEYLAVDNDPIILEGEWKYSKTVIIQFPSEEEFKCWYESEEYQAILKHRLKAAICDTILVRGRAHQVDIPT